MKLLADIDELRQAGPFYSLKASSAFKRASLRARSYRDVYDAGAANQDFNCMLNDGSYFQFTETSTNELRYAYYPNPYQFVEYLSERDVASMLLEDEEISQEEFDQLISESIFTSDVPLIRYDLSMSQYCSNYHPAAHLHVGFYVENRWAVRRVLTPLAFMLDVLHHYYPKIWRNAGGEVDEDPNDLDDVYRKEIGVCEMLDDEYFTPKEAERLYFT